VLNSAGEVLAIHLGGGAAGGELRGVGNPVKRFRAFLEEAAAKSPPR
jgi:hypothetical protein